MQLAVSHVQSRPLAGEEGGTVHGSRRLSLRELRKPENVIAYSLFMST